MAAMASAGVAQTLFTNGSYITHSNGGPGGAPRSQVQTTLFNLTSHGFGAQLASNNRVADDFNLPARARITGFSVYAFQAGATGNSITSLNARLFAGAVTSGNVVWGNTTTNVLDTVVNTGVFRLDDRDPFVDNRPIMEVRGAIAGGIVVQPGPHSLDVQMDGSLASGPWIVPVTILGQANKSGSNARFFNGQTSVWGNVNDAGSGTAQDMAFVLRGIWLLSPNSVSILEGSLLGGSEASLLASDDARYTVILDELDGPAEVRFNSTSPSTTVTRLDLTFESVSTRNDLMAILQVRNTAGDWEWLDSSFTSLTDVVRSIAITSNPGRFIRPGGVIELRYIAVPINDVFDADGWSIGFDEVRWDVVPG